MFVYRIRLWLSLLIVPLSICILQAHGIPFWYSIVRFHTGDPRIDWAPAVLWSLSLEVVSIWRWLGNEKYKVFAIVVTLLLIGGPLVNTLKPLFAQVVIEETVSDEEVEEAATKVKYYEDLIAAGRRGFLPTLERWEAELLKRQSATKITTVSQNVGWLKAIMVSASLVIFTLATVLALTDLGGRGNPSRSVAQILRRVLKRYQMEDLITELNVAQRLIENILAGKPVKEEVLNDIVRRLRRSTLWQGQSRSQKIQREIPTGVPSGTTK